MVKKISFQIIRILYLFVGLFIASLGTVLIVRADIGVDSWSVLHIGITLHTPLTIGKACQLIGVVLIIAGLFLKIKPGIGTIMNMYFIGFFQDFIFRLNFIKQPDSLLWSWIYLMGGIIIFGAGCGLYINSNFGAGPRDGLMLGLAKLTGKSVAFIKTIIELTVTVIGFLLGGPVGIGTVVFALLVGHIIQWSLKNLKLPSHEVQQSDYRGKIST